jgi:hypothetical protein
MEQTQEGDGSLRYIFLYFFRIEMHHLYIHEIDLTVTNSPHDSSQS